MLLVANYHYVRSGGGHPHPGIFPTSISELEAQLRALAVHCEFVDQQDIVAAVRRERSLPESACLVTFDDGLAEQYVNAAPVLERLGIRGVFFCCSAPLVGQALAVHKAHWLQATRPLERYENELRESAERSGVTLPFDRIEDLVVERQYLYDDGPTGRLKFLLNHLLPFDDYERLVTDMFQRERDEREFCAELYMDTRQISELARRHSIGSHAHSHRPLAPMGADGMHTELTRSKHALELATGRVVELVSYPYGGPTAVSPMVAAEAARCGYVAGFTMERALNRTMNEALLLGRFSTADLPGGTHPVVSWHERTCVVQAPATAGRTRYASEQ